MNYFLKDHQCHQCCFLSLCYCFFNYFFYKLTIADEEKTALIFQEFPLNFVKIYFIFSLPTLPTMVYWESTKLKWVLSWVLVWTYSSLERSIIVQENSKCVIVLLIDAFVHYLWALKHFTIVSRTSFLVLLLYFANISNIFFASWDGCLCLRNRFKCLLTLPVITLPF